MTDSPFAVTSPNKKTSLLVMNANDGLPAAFALMGTRAERRVALRVGGGCKGMDAADKEYMLCYFSAALDGYKGVIWSGGTRQVTAGALDPMVTDVPGVIASENPGCVALGTVPRVALMSLQGDSRLVLDNYGTVPNPSMSGILIVQNGPDGELGWDGDVDTYFRLMQQWRDHAGFTSLGVIAWNGGPITRDEILRSARRGWPTFLVRGSGRETDAVITAHESGEGLGLPKDHKVEIVDRIDAGTLRDALSKHGFIDNTLVE